MQDEVLTRFMEKARELELAVGPQLRVLSQDIKKPIKKKLSDQIKEFNSPKNALRYYTVIDFKTAISQRGGHVKTTRNHRRNIFTPPLEQERQSTGN